MYDSEANPLLIQLNNQKALEVVYDWFVVQKNPLSRWADRGDPLVGRLRGDDGAKNPVGLLVDNDSYDIIMDTDFSLVSSGDRPFSLLIDYSLEFLYDITDAHDQCLGLWASKEEEKARLQLKMNLCVIAAKWHLEIPEQE